MFTTMTQGTFLSSAGDPASPEPAQEQDNQRHDQQHRGRSEKEAQGFDDQPHQQEHHGNGDNSYGQRFHFYRPSISTTQSVRTWLR
jgi:hypothetical protein